MLDGLISQYLLFDKFEVDHTNGKAIKSSMPFPCSTPCMTVSHQKRPPPVIGRGQVKIEFMGQNCKCIMSKTLTLIMFPWTQT